MAVEGPHARVVRHEPEHRPPVRKDDRRVPQRRVPEVEPRFVGGVPAVRAVAVAQHPEVVAVEVPRVHLADVARQRVGVLEQHVDGGVVRQDVHVVPHRRVGVRRRQRHVVFPAERLRGARRRQRRLEPHLQGAQVRRGGQNHGHVVDGPPDAPVHPVLRVEQLDAAGRRRRRRGRPGARADPVRERLAVAVVVPRRGDRRRECWQVRRAVGAVVEHCQRRRRLGQPAAHAHADPVVRGRVLVRREQDGVAVAGVEVDVVHNEWVHVVAVGLHHRQLVILQKMRANISMYVCTMYMACAKSAATYYPDREVERRERGGAGHPEPVGLVRLHGEYHRRALRVGGGGGALVGGPLRVRCGQRAVELASPVDQQRLHRNTAHDSDKLNVAKFRLGLAPEFRLEQTESSKIQCPQNVECEPALKHHSFGSREAPKSSTCTASERSTCAQDKARRGAGPCTPPPM
jgi:hypothetical protein